MNASRKKGTVKRVSNAGIQKCTTRYTYKTRSRQPRSPGQQFKRLVEELDLIQDTLAPIYINYLSLYNAYESSGLENEKSATRLCDKERELLTGYDELDLQACHLSKKMTELESRIAILKELEECQSSPMTSPCSSIETSLFGTPRLDSMKSDFDIPHPSYCNPFDPMFF